MKILLLIGLGGFVGSILRFLISETIQTKSVGTFPYGTLAVNLIGCFVIGVIFALVSKTSVSSELKYFLATGLIGGFTTFSAFSFETFALFRAGQIWNAALYIILSVSLGLVATMLGFQAFRLS